MMKFEIYFQPSLSQCDLVNQAGKFIYYQMALIITGIKLVPLYLNNRRDCRVEEDLERLYPCLSGSARLKPSCKLSVFVGIECCGEGGSWKLSSMNSISVIILVASL